MKPSIGAIAICKRGITGVICKKVIRKDRTIWRGIRVNGQGNWESREPRVVGHISDFVHTALALGITP